jgi:hypothetical protein
MNDERHVMPSIGGKKIFVGVIVIKRWHDETTHAKSLIVSAGSNRIGIFGYTDGYWMEYPDILSLFDHIQKNASRYPYVCAFDTREELFDWLVSPITHEDINGKGAVRMNDRARSLVEL